MAPDGAGAAVPSPLRSLTLPAPAKLNLFLHVVGRRDDGYHLLETLFQLLDFGDSVTLELTDEPGVTRVAGAPGVAPEDDLVVRAARALLAARPAPGGVRISVDKRLPMGGGLGGGSSDAASVLLGLNHLWGLGLDPDELGRLGLALGADVPVFVAGRSALARGVGEDLTPVRLAPAWYVVACPAVEVATASVFGADSLTRDTQPLKIGGFPWEMDTEAGLDRLLVRTRNDCEPVVRAMCPDVARAIEWLSGHASARLTGTGACVFARFATKDAAQAVAERAPAGLRVFVARGTNQSTALDAIEGDAAGTRI